MNTSTATTTEKTWKRPLEWFKSRIGQRIYRGKYFTHEKQQRENPCMIVQSAEHAETLFDIQKPGKPLYHDRPDEVE